MLLKKSLKFNNYIVNRLSYRCKYEWVEPVGYDTGIKVYHEILKEKVPLIFPDKNFVKWYMCGPTVYDVAHVGHGSCYIKFDIIRRLLKQYFDVDPIVAISVTDVSEEIYKKSSILKKPWQEVAEMYETEFFKQMNVLNVLEPNIKLRVNDHIEIIIEFIKKLINRRAAYKGSDGNIYFNTEADINYGRFRPPQTEHLLQKAPGKRNHCDFALWRTSKYKFHSPWGDGIPGWHIECSAMASLVFGSAIDLHSGGSDLIFPHHENEEAQSVCYHKNKQWVNYWLHAGLLNIEEEKMSKSLGNHVSINQFLVKNCSDHLRMFCLMSPYRAGMNFSSSTLKLAENMCDKVIEFLETADLYVKGNWPCCKVVESEIAQEIAKTKEEVKQHLSDDFGYHEAVKSVMNLIKIGSRMLSETEQETSSRSPAAMAALYLYVQEFFKSFGFSFVNLREKSAFTSPLETLINTTVNFRSQIRNIGVKCDEPQLRKELFQLCDKSRNKLTNLGITVKDGQSSSWWRMNHSDLQNKNMLVDVVNIAVHLWADIVTRQELTKSGVHSTELSNICQLLKMRLGTLGIRMEICGNDVEWTFQATDCDGLLKCEEIIKIMLNACNEIRKVAEKVQDETVQKELLTLCDITSTLDDHGVRILNEEESVSLSVDNVTGKFILNNFVNLLLHIREQLSHVQLETTDSKSARRIALKCSELKKCLKYLGIIVTEGDFKNQVKWSIQDRERNRNIITKLIDATVKLLPDMKTVAETINDAQAKTVLHEIYESAIEDLSSLGVTVKIEAKGRHSWHCQVPSPGRNFNVKNDLKQYSKPENKDSHSLSNTDIDKNRYWKLLLTMPQKQ